MSEYGEKERKQVLDIQAKIEAAEIAHANRMTNNIIAGMKALAAAQATIIESVVSDTPQAEIALTKIQQALLKGVDAARSMGVAVRLDLVEALYKAQAAEKAFAASGIQDAQAMAALKQNTVDAQKALDNYGKAVDNFKAKSHGLWSDFQRDSKAGATGLDHVKQSGVNAFDDISKNVEGAFQSIVLGTGNVAQALEKATAASLAQVAAQAAVKALYYTGEGFAALAGFNAGSASQYFTAAGEMAAVASVAGVAGAALNGAAGGGEGGSSNHQQGHDSVTNTGQSNRSGGSVTGVQAFAEGGIITGPTIALMGEAGSEAVIPLDDPQAKQQLQGVGGGGDTHIHLDVHGGLIAESTITHLCKQISKSVDKGRVNLTASNSLRITKRSA